MGLRSKQAVQQELSGPGRQQKMAAVESGWTASMKGLNMAVISCAPLMQQSLAGSGPLMNIQCRSTHQQSDVMPCQPPSRSAVQSISAC